MAEFKAENNCIATTTIREAKIYENNKEAYWGSFGGGHVDCLAGHGSTNSLHARNDQRASVQTEDGISRHIASVDTATMTVSLKGRPGSPTTKVKLTHDTKIKKDGQPAQFTDLVEGLRISGSGKKGEDGVWTANTLNIRTAPPAASKAAPTTTKTPE